MAKFEKINGAWFDLDQMKGKTKTQFNATYKDQRIFPFDNDDTYAKIQAELKKLEPEKK